MGNVVRLQPTTTYTVDQALDFAKSEGMTEVVVAGYDKNGNFMVVSSAMSNDRAAWFGQKIVLAAHGVLDE